MLATRALSSPGDPASPTGGGHVGSSAPHYGIALLQTLHALGSVETHLVLSDGARRTIQLETDLDPEVVCRLGDVVHHPNNLAASISSGSFLYDGPLAGTHLPLHVRSSYADGCPVNSSIADAFDSLIPHLKARDVSLLRPICDFTIRRIQHALGNHGPELPVTIAPQQWLM